MLFRLKRKDLPNLEINDAVFVIEYFKDYNPRDAAERAGMDGELGYKMMKKPEIEEAIQSVIQEGIDDLQYDAQSLLMDLHDNFKLARQKGNLSAANKSLELMARHVSVDAMAKQKVELDVVSDEKIMEKLQRGRKRAKLIQITDNNEVTFL